MIEFPLLGNYQENIGIKSLDLIKRDISICNNSLENITSLLDREQTPKLVGNMDLIKIIYEERVKLDIIIHEYLYRGQD